MSRECPEQRKDFQGGRGARGGGFLPSAGNDHSGFRSSTNSSNTFQAMRHQNDNDEAKQTFTGWRGGAGNTNNDNSDDTNKRSAFGNSAIRGGFTSSGTGFRGKVIIW